MVLVNLEVYGSVYVIFCDCSSVADVGDVVVRGLLYLSFYGVS